MATKPSSCSATAIVLSRTISLGRDAPLPDGARGVAISARATLRGVRRRT